MASVSSMNNTCCMNVSGHVAQSMRNHTQQLYYGTLKYKGLGRHSRNKRYSACRIVAEKLDIDFSDPDWKTKYQKDFESRFNLPHLKDVLNVKPRPTTFSLIQRDGARWSGKVDDSAEGPEDRKNDYVNNDDRTLLKVIKYSSPDSAGAECIDPDCTWVEQWVHRAGPRKKIYFEPKKVKAAIVTCGGLCPGLNDVIRQIFFTLERYGVQQIFGVRYDSILLHFALDSCQSNLDTLLQVFYCNFPIYFEYYTSF